MSSYSEYYETNLYPLQDGVLKCVEESSAGFFLTGGTALSRVYCNHRYSDDLALFLCSDLLFNEKVDKVLESLRKGGYSYSNEKNFIRTADFTSIYVQHPGLPEIALKVDFVNDVADIYAICRVYSFCWEELVEETRQKEAGFEVPLAVGLKQIVFDLTRGKENTLVGLI
jgi:hypothetical protein